MTALDPKLLKVIALWRSTEHAGEKAAAQARAEAMAAAAGMTLDEAIAAVDAPVPTSTNFMAGFDEFMEREEPGYRARRAAEKAEKERERLARRTAIIARCGSEEAALAPCIHKARIRWPNATAAMVVESRMWLAAHGYDEDVAESMAPQIASGGR